MLIFLIMGGMGVMSIFWCVGNNVLYIRQDSQDYKVDFYNFLLSFLSSVLGYFQSVYTDPDFNLLKKKRKKNKKNGKTIAT